jgi:DNA polymerase-3 subunit alpha
MSAAGFVHLNVHTEYSLVDSTVRIKPLIARAAAMGMPAVALTDQSNLFALVKFYRAAQRAGIKPVVGADIWVENPEDPSSPHRLLLLCQSRDGYLSLCRMVSRAYLERAGRNRPVIKRSWLTDGNAGLIALSGQQFGEVGQLILEGKSRRAEAALKHWMSIFDQDRFYLEVCRNGHAHEELYLDECLALAATNGCPVVATNQVRFLDRADFDAHEARVCINQGRVLDDPQRPRDYTPAQYLRSPEEMSELFADLPELLSNSIELAKRCNLELDFGTYYLPDFPVPEGQTVDTHLREESLLGLEQRLERGGPAEGYTREDYLQRLDHELGVIIQMGFPGYFLIVADFIRWGKKNDVPVGPGRGSGAGSLVAYSLGITDLDPLRYDLLFERFLNPERVSMPDFDVDFCMDRRDEVIDYVARRYGRDQVCQIITYGSMAAKAVVRDTGRVLGHPYGFVDGIAKLIPPTLGITLEKALEEESELRLRVEQEEDVGELMELARSLEGLTRNAGKHPGGVVIAPGPLPHFSPLYSEPNGDGVVTQFDKDDVETIGLVKFDFLGLRTLTIIDWAVKAINVCRRQAGEPELDIVDLPMEDEATFELLKACNTTAVFQLESRGMKDLIRRLQPGSFDDIVALVALFRPGPLDSGMVDTYVDCKHGRQQVRYPHPLLEPILKSTHGVILYQEQVMQIAQEMAGYTLGGADILRRAMGKKKPEEMAKQRKIFVDGSVERGIEAQLAESIFDLMEKFAGYGFNKSHSAAYALLSYQTAWLKAHYPAEFMAAVLSSDMDNTDKVVNFIDDASAQGLTLLAPDVNQSGYAFTASDAQTIVYGLGAIKGVGRSAIEAIVDERQQNGPYADLMDLCDRIDLQRVNKRVLEALIYAGAADSLGVNRATLMNALPDVLHAAEQESRNRAAGQSDMFGSAAPVPRAGAPRELPEWPDEQRLLGERETLGLYFSGHPIDPWVDDLSQIISARLGGLGEIYRPPPNTGKPRRGRPAGQPCVVAGLVTNIRKRGENMAFVQLDDQTGRIEVSVFREPYQLYGDLLHRDAILVVEGNLSEDDFSGGFQVRAKRLLTADEAYSEYARGLRLRIARNNHDLATLKRILDNHRPGTSEVLVNYGNANAVATLKLGPDWRIRVSRSLMDELQASGCVSEVRALFGGGQVH